MQNRGTIIKKKHANKARNTVEYVKKEDRSFSDLVLLNRASINET